MSVVVVVTLTRRYLSVPGIMVIWQQEERKYWGRGGEMWIFIPFKAHQKQKHRITKVDRAIYRKGTTVNSSHPPARCYETHVRTCHPSSPSSMASSPATPPKKPSRRPHLSPDCVPIFQRFGVDEVEVKVSRDSRPLME